MNRPDGPSRERLILLIEECGEVIQAASKVLRHGYASVNPLVPPVRAKTNREMLEKEIGQVLNAVALLVANEDVVEGHIDFHRRAKAESIHSWLHYEHKGVTGV